MQKIANHAWKIMLLVGLLVVAYAYYNVQFVPGLAANDPDFGWAWLTQDLEVVEYIQYIFRFLGLWTLLSGIMISVIAATGFRDHQKWAWYALAFVPIHLILMTWLAPWIAPIMGAVVVLTLIGLLAPLGKFFPKSTA